MFMRLTLTVLTEPYSMLHLHNQGSGCRKKFYRRLWRRVHQLPLDSVEEERKAKVDGKKSSSGKKRKHADGDFSKKSMSGPQKLNGLGNK